MNASAALWMVDADAVAEADLQRYLGWLSAGEAARCQRFVRAQRRRQFIAGRVLLRMALGRLLGVAAREVELQERTGHAPRLVAPMATDSLPGFSIAHSGRWVACAVSAQTALGLDIELRDPGRDLAALAGQAFDADEMAQWTRAGELAGGVDGEAGVDAFYRLWSEKEARFKLGVAPAGHCLALPHAELSVVLCSALPLARPPQIETVTLV